MPRSLEQILAQAEELADAFAHYQPQKRDQDSSSSLLALHLASSRRSDADRSVLDAVAASRAEGISWAVIGEILGTSGEAARQRYGALLNQAR